MNMVFRFTKSMTHLMLGEEKDDEGEKQAQMPVEGEEDAESKKQAQMPVEGEEDAESETQAQMPVEGEEDTESESETEAQMLIDKMGEEATGFFCAAEDKCGMNNTPFTNRDTHRCKTCEKRVHGMLCCVPQSQDEEGSIFYCLKCGRPEDHPEKKAAPRNTYNLRRKKNRQVTETTAAATALATLAKTSEALAKTSENSAKTPDKSAKTPEKSATASEKSPTALHKQIESPKKGIKRPEKVADVKGHNTARIFEVTARQVMKLQVATTWEEEEDRQEKPSCQYALLSCDEMLQKPFVKERYKRKDGQELLTLQASEGFDHRKWGRRIKAMGADMEKGKRSGKNWKIVDNVLEHHKRIFGSAMKFRPYGGGDKKQADTYNDLLGPGYERLDEGDRKPAAKRSSSGKKSIQRKRSKKS